MAESTQHKLSRNRPPRVQITYDVETAGAIQTKELPLVVGILSDLAGKSEHPLAPLKDRKFIEIDRDNFDDVMAGIGPGLALQVPDRLRNDPEALLNVALKFNSMDDFNPINIVNQVDELRKLFLVRQRLTDLMAKLDGNDKLDAILQETINNSDGLNELSALNETTGGNGNGQ